MLTSYAQVLPKLQLTSTTMTDIRNNVAMGRTVTVHEKNISYKGWSGNGYIIIDPNTGAGAYLIDGGANGGIFIAIGIMLVILAVFLEFAILAGSTVTFGAAWFAQPLVVATLGAGLSFITKGIEILTSNQSFSNQNPCNLFKIAYSILWSGVGAMVAGQVWLGTAVGAATASTDFTGIDVCYSPSD